MRKSLRTFEVAVLAGLAFAFSGINCLAAEILESAVLRLEVTTSPYSYRIVERGTGDVLVSQSGHTLFTDNEYAAIEATAVTRTLSSMRAVLRLAGTPDTAQLTFTFIKPEVVQVLLTFNHGILAEVREEFNDSGEHYYGLWEMPFGGNIDNRGAEWDFLGMRRHADVNYASARAPFYLTSKKYGIYVHSSAKGRFTIAKQGKTAFSFHDNELRYDVIYGPYYPDVLNRYNAIAGPAIMPPDWAFGSIWWRDDEHDDLRGATNAQEKVLDDADQLRALRMPAGTIWLDRPFGTGEMGWGNMDFDSSFPDPTKMVRDLNDRGMNLLLWIANRAWNELLMEGLARRYLYFGKESAADIQSPGAYDWFKTKLDEYVRLGVKGYKIDRGEEDEMPLSDENLHAILLPKLAAEGLSEAYRNDFFTFSRNANDTARKYTAVWNGDTFSSFSGLEVSLKNALRCGAINFPMWGSDTGGYIGNPDKELFARWLEFSAFSPMMELLLGPKRTIWHDYDQELVDIATNYVAFHHDLIPYTRSYMYQATQTGMPIMRALILEYPDDDSLSDTWNEYLYGGILVAPVTTALVDSREVYLPAGRWINYNDKRTIYQGKALIKATAPLGTIPLFVREGTIIPRGDIVKLNNNWDTPWAPKLRIEIFPSDRQSSQFDYFTGQEVQAIKVAPEGGVTIQFGDLRANGNLEIYCQKIRRIMRNGRTLHEGTDYQYDSKSHKLTVSFQGATKLEIRGCVSLFTAISEARGE